MSIGQGDNHLSTSSDIDNDLKDDVLVMSNPIFQEKEASSKITTVVGELKKLKKLYDEDKTKPFEKAIVVSQWTSMLNVVKVHVSNLGLKIAEINGKKK